MLAGGGVESVLRCRAMLDKEIHVEDHVVVCAEVISVLVKGENTDKKQKSSGLCYAEGEYRESNAFELEDMTASDPAAEAKKESAAETANIQQTIGLGVRRGDEAYGGIEGDLATR